MLHGLTTLLPEDILTTYDNLEFMIRIFCAAILGGSIGLERSKKQKGAGVRTHCIVAITSAVFMILSKYAFVDLGDVIGTRGADSARIAAQVVSGISFLGAGIIFKQGKASVKGLTTAAGMWATAAIGLAIGAGMYWLGFFQTLMILVLQTILHHGVIGPKTLTEQTIIVHMKDNPDMLEEFHQFIDADKCIIDDSSVIRDGEWIRICLSIRTENPIEYEHVLEFMNQHPDVTEITV